MNCTRTSHIAPTGDKVRDAQEAAQDRVQALRPRRRGEAPPRARGIIVHARINCVGKSQSCMVTGVPPGADPHPRDRLEPGRAAVPERADDARGSGPDRGSAARDGGGARPRLGAGARMYDVRYVGKSQSCML